MPFHGELSKTNELQRSSDSVIASPSCAPRHSHPTKGRARWLSLHNACSKGDNETLTHLIHQGADVNELSYDGSTPLTLAAYHGHSRCVKILLKNSADCNVKNNNGDQPLHLAVKRNHKKIARRLIKHGADVNSRGSTGMCPIHTASKYGSAKLLRMLLDHGARTDRYTDTDNPQHALHLAAARGHATCVSILLQFNNYTEPRDSNGRTPLFLAVLKNHRAAVLVLVLAGCDVNAPEKAGRLPVHVAINYDFDAICHTLCEHGADVSLRYLTPAKEDIVPCITDRFGQIKPPEVSDLIGDITKIGDEARALQSELSRVKQWERMLKHWPKYTRYKMDSVRKRVGKGIPDCLRSQAWKQLSHLGHEVELPYFNDLRARESTWVHQIDLDVSRAYRNHLMYRTRYGQAQCSLFGMLKAYSNFDTELGYCQGMGDQAALLMKYFTDRETFSVFDIIMKDSRYGLRGCYLPGFPKLQRTFYVHEKLLEAIDPILYNHLHDEGATVPLYATKWYMTAFLDIFSFEITLRVYDLFFLDGYDILYSVAIAILMMFKADLLNMRFDKIMVFMHSLTQRTVDVDEFITYIVTHRISSRTIRKYERMYDDDINEKHTMQTPRTNQ